MSSFLRTRAGGMIFRKGFGAAGLQCLRPLAGLVLII